MNYVFPKIETIDDVLPHVEGRDEFVVADRGDHTIINYVALTSDTFRPDVEDEGNLIRRECRGLIFDNSTREIVRRPFHKFFNAGEREETMLDKLDLTQDHIVMIKLDGSMIAPYIVWGDQISSTTKTLYFGTKMGYTDVAKQAEAYVNIQEELGVIHYNEFIIRMIGIGLTPIFEWTSRQQRIVLNYPEDALTLLALRDMKSGNYITRHGLELYTEQYNIPLVPVYKSTNNINELVHMTRNEVDNEGYVVQFDDGHMVKIKSDWYVAIHKTKENLLYERYVVELILNNTLDDVLSFVTDDDKKRLQEYADVFIREYTRFCMFVAHNSWSDIFDYQIDRKTFALQHQKKYPGVVQIIFRHGWSPEVKNHTRNSWNELIKTELEKVFRHNCLSNTKLAEFKKLIGFTFTW